MDNKAFTNPKELIAKIKKVLDMHQAGKTVDEISAETGISKSVIKPWIEQVVIPALTLPKSTKKD